MMMGLWVSLQDSSLWNHRFGSFIRPAMTMCHNLQAHCLEDPKEVWLSLTSKREQEIRNSTPNMIDLSYDSNSCSHTFQDKSWHFEANFGVLTSGAYPNVWRFPGGNNDGPRDFWGIQSKNLRQIHASNLYIYIYIKAIFLVVKPSFPSPKKLWNCPTSAGPELYLRRQQRPSSELGGSPWAGSGWSNSCSKKKSEDHGI